MNRTKTMIKSKTLDEIKKDVLSLRAPDDPDIVMKEAGRMIDQDIEKYSLESYDSPIFKALTVFEFSNAYLLANSVPAMYRTFGISLFKQLKEEYACQTVSEQATAELVTLSYIRMMVLQRKVNKHLESSELGRIDISFFSLLSKDLDRVTRQYFTAIHMLRTFKQPAFTVNIKTNTAIVGQNQAVQEQHYGNTPI